MGVSTDATFGWGIAFDEAVSYNGEVMWKVNKILQKEGLDVEVACHCSYECPMLAFLIKSTSVTAHRGYPQKLDMKLADPRMADVMRPLWESQILKAIDIYQREWSKAYDDLELKLEEQVSSDKLGWFLFSTWG